MAKVQSQVQGMVTPDQRPGALEVYTRIISEGGSLLALWEGVLPQLTNAVLKEAFSNAFRPIFLRALTGHRIK